MSLYGGGKTLWEMKVNVEQDTVGMKNREMEKQVLSAWFMLGTADRARIAIVNLFGQSVPYLEMFFITMLFKNYVLSSQLKTGC